MKLYKFTPNEEMSTLELAQVLEKLLVSLMQGLYGRKIDGSEPLQIDDAILNSMPEECRKYFVEQKNPVVDDKAAVKEEMGDA